MHLSALFALCRPAVAQDGAEVSLGGYVETFWSWNFADPENGVTSLRAFDSRHDSVTLSNAALDVVGVVGDVRGRVVVQAGLAPNTYTLAEPTHPAVGGVGGSDAATWRNLQQAVVGWAPEPVSFDAGLFLSPVGPESLAAKDDWSFSRSNLFYGLPFYHTGAHLSWEASDATKVVAGVCNGWNSVVDNNRGKSPSLQVLLSKAPVSASLLYLGGPERSIGAPEGQPWRHLGDAWVQVDAGERLSLLGQVDAGYERNLLGSNRWLAAALSLRVEPVPRWFVAARGDWFRETTTGTSSPLFWPVGDDAVGRVASGTLTVDWRPADGLSLRLEGRHDDGDDPMFFDQSVLVGDGLPVAEDRVQHTVTIAAIGWFGAP